MSLHGQVVLVTGASKGIGKAVALRVAQEGANIVINYLNDHEGAAAVVQQVGGHRAIAVQADTSKISDIEKLVDAAVQKFGKIDVLMPNAAIMEMRDLASTTEEDFDQAFSLNVKGPYFLCQKAVPHMPEGARVILVSTGVCAVSNVAPPYLLYAATKGAIEQMTRVLAKDLARKGIIVNAVAPGPTATKLFFNGKSEETLQIVRGFSPFNRIGTPEDIAAVVAFMCSKDSRWMAGHILKVNGAMA